MIALLVVMAAQMTHSPSAQLMPPPPHPPTQQEKIDTLRSQGFSKAAIDLMRAEEASENQLALSARSLSQASLKEQARLLDQVPFDAAAFERTFRARQQAARTLEALLLDVRLAMLRRLPPADRARYARDLLAQQLVF